MGAVLLCPCACGDTLDADPLPYVAVVNGPQALGYCNALLERHLPFDLIRAEQVERKRLDAYRAVIVSDAGDLGQQGVAARSIMSRLAGA